MIRRAASLLLLAAAATAAVPQPQETVYLELWQEEASESPETSVSGPRMLVAVGQPTSSAAPIARWCQEQRDRAGDAPKLPRTLLREAPYDAFTSGAVPILLEVLIDDVELRYALGTERPSGASGLEFPFLELCALGYGSRSEPEWAIDLVHVANHRGDEMVFGLYKGTLPIAERAYLESQLGYPVALPDPAGVLLLGQGQDLQMLLLELSADGEAFAELRRRIVR